MVQPKKPPVSLRLPETVKIAVEQYAAERGIPRNAAYVEVIQRGLNPAASNAAQVPQAPAPKAKLAEAAAPVKSQAKPPKVSLQVGPERAAPGSRLKKR